MKGTNSSSNCILCNNEKDYHFDNLKSNHCITFEELPYTNYYLYKKDDTFKLCNDICLICNGPNNSNCLTCNNDKGYYFKEDEDNNTCFSINETENTYYLDTTINIIKKCNHRCLKCNEEGSDSSSICLVWNNNDDYHFDPLKEKHCLKYDELRNINYYLNEEYDKYDLCFDKCLTCNGPFENNCTLCNVSKGYYFKENDNSQKCYSKDNIELGYYLDESEQLFKKCNKGCLKCDIGGTDSNTNCLICINDNGYHFDPNKENHCIKFENLINTNYYLNNIDEKFQLCHESCLRCDGPNYNNCLCCFNSKGYFFKESNSSNICYTQVSIEIGYYLDSSYRINKKCNPRCLTCNNGGNNDASNCETCNNNNNYHFSPNVPNHCVLFDELPNVNYYLDFNTDKYRICHQSCLECIGPNNNDCTSCYN